MRDPGTDHGRQILLEAFTAGWRAALVVNVMNPRVLAVIESCFDLWLQEAVDEVEVLGLSFRRREDLPASRPATASPGLPVQRNTNAAGAGPWPHGPDGGRG